MMLSRERQNRKCEISYQINVLIILPADRLINLAMLFVWKTSRGGPMKPAQLLSHTKMKYDGNSATCPSSYLNFFLFVATVIYKGRKFSSECFLAAGIAMNLYCLASK